MAMDIYLHLLGLWSFDADDPIISESYPSPLPSVKRAPICPSNVSKETEARLLDLMQKQGVKILGRSSEC